MHPVDAFAYPVLVLAGSVLSMLVVWERWPHVHWWLSERVRRWRVDRDLWLMEHRHH